MATELLSFPIDAPGSKGLNTQSDSSSIDPEYATTATNVVIDESGRLASRKGWQALNSTAITGTPNVEQVIEYITGSGTTVVVSAAGSKLYSGTEPLADITGSVSVSANNWKFQNFNNKVVGFQASHEPIVYNGAGTFEYLVDSHTAWASSTAYVVGDVVRPTTHSGLYYECTAAGTSDTTEPTWDTDLGDYTVDGTVTWITREIPKGNECLPAYGRIWAPDANGNVIYYSDLLIPQALGSTGGSAGSIDLRSVWVGGMDSIQALGAINGKLVIFGKESIILYNGADNVDNLALAEVIRGTGCVARDSVQNIGNDMLFLAADGVRSLGRAVMQESLPFTSLSKNVWQRLSNFLQYEDTSLIRSTYNRREGFYLLSFPTSGRVMCFDLKEFIAGGNARIFLWDNINPSAMYSGVDDTLYFGQAGYLGTYAGYQDNGSNYIMTYWSGWVDFAKVLSAPQLINRTLLVKNIRATIQAAENFVATVQWNYDYSRDSKGATFTVVGGGTLAEYGVAEYGIAEYGGGTFTTQIKVAGKGGGRLIRFGLTCPVRGTEVKVQRIEIFTKVGRLS